MMAGVDALGEDQFGPNLLPPHAFLRYTLSPTFSSRFGIVTLPSVDAMMIVFPEDEGPNSFERSTLIVNKVPSTVISTFFMTVSSSQMQSIRPAISRDTRFHRNRTAFHMPRLS
jgi:hypothetical protein